MKYYTYISETKVNMLYDQIPSNLREKVASELKIDLKVISTTLSEQPSNKNLIKKLELVTNSINKSGHPGTIDKPSLFFSGKLKMKWGKLHSDNQNAVLFVGRDETTACTVILGGSTKHVLGEKEIPTSISSLSTSSFSIFPSIHNWLLNLDWQAFQIDIDSEFRGKAGDLIGVSRAIFLDQGPIQIVEFLAINFFADYYSWDEKIIIGSPIYVALSDNKSTLNNKNEKRKQFWNFWKPST